jgi:hypothetical protein
MKEKLNLLNDYLFMSTWTRKAMKKILRFVNMYKFRRLKERDIINNPLPVVDIFQ